ncbi:MAG: hypothetical protein K8S00_04780 [Bacteroidales bacterium]|nr:hypothetical protein [Bacteroidales bacterium]
MKKIINIAIWIVLIVGLALLLGFSSVRHKKLTCKHFEISIRYNEADTFLRVMNIEKEIIAAGDSIIGKKLKKINTGDIEKMLMKNPYIINADVYSTVEGNIQINIVQRQPIVRVINKHNKGYYIDSEGTLMPLSQKSTTRVLVANGNINELYSSSIRLSGDPENINEEKERSNNLQNIFYLASYINKDNFLKSMIDQIYITKNNEIELIPKVGNHLIIFGKTDDLEVKFNNLKALYNDGFKKTGWNKYKTINLKYKNQVVCSKK